MVERQAGQRWPFWMGLCEHAFGLRGTAPNAVVVQRMLNGAFDVLGGASAGLRTAMQDAARMAAFAVRPADAAGPGTLGEFLLCGAFAARAERRDSAALEALQTYQRWHDAPGAVLPVLLVNEDDPQRVPRRAVDKGVVVTLHLKRVELDFSFRGRSDASDRSLFVAGPGSVLLEAGPLLVKSLQHASRVILARLGLDNVDKAPFRLVWDLIPRVDTLGPIDGPSAGASFALAGLGRCINDLQPSDPLRHDLGLIDWPRAAITAKLRDSGEDLDAVRGVHAKLDALRGEIAPGRLQLTTLFVSSEQNDAVDPPYVQLCSNVAALARQVSRQTNVKAHYGEIPDAVSLLREVGSGTSDPYADFVGREWLTQCVRDALNQLPPSGGVVIVTADMLFGKTAWALRQVEEVLASEHGGASRSHIALDGWAFARGTAGVGRVMTVLSGDARTVIAQLDAQTRYRLDISVRGEDRADRSTDAGGALKDLLHRCSAAAKSRQRPVRLLLDGVNEVFDDLHGLLPRQWPTGVQLILLGQPSVFRADAMPAVPYIRHALSGDAHERQAHVDDLRAWVRQRAQTLAPTIGRDLGSAEIDAIVRASDGVFLMATALMADPAQMLDWLRMRNSMPSGMRGLLKVELDRLHRVALDRALPPDCIPKVLCFLALCRGNRTWTLDQLCHSLFFGWHQLAADLTFKQALDRIDRDRGLKFWTLEATEQAIACAAHLLGGPEVIGGGRKLEFRHAYFPTVLEQLAKDKGWFGPLHAIWGILCEQVFATHCASSDAAPIEVQAALRDTLGDYALLHGPMHLALAAGPGEGNNQAGTWYSADTRAWRTNCWRRAAQRLLDVGPQGVAQGLDSSYLQQLFQSSTPGLPNLAWPTVRAAIDQLLESELRTGAGLADLASQIGVLRHVLSSQHRMIVAGRTPLLMALHNAMAGRWPAWTALADSIARPWLRASNPRRWLASTSPAPIETDGIACFVCSPDGRYLVAGMHSGECRVWTPQALADGGTGILATRHAEQGGVTTVAVVTGGVGAHAWCVASGGADGQVLVAAADTADSKGLPSGAVTAARHNGPVTCVSMVWLESPPRWLLASGGIDGQVHLAVQGGDGPITLAVGGFDDQVTALALVPSEDAASLWLGVGCGDGSVNVANCQAGASAGPEGLDTLVATRHGDAVRCLALLPQGPAAGTCWFASAADDGEVRSGQAHAPPSLSQRPASNAPWSDDVVVHAVAALQVALWRGPGPGSTVVVTGGRDGTVRVANAATGDTMHVAPAPVLAAPITALTIRPWDEHMLLIAAGSQAGDVQGYRWREDGLCGATGGDAIAQLSELAGVGFMRGAASDWLLFAGTTGGRIVCSELSPPDHPMPDEQGRPDRPPQRRRPRLVDTACSTPSARDTPVLAMAFADRSMRLVAQGPGLDSSVQLPTAPSKLALLAVANHHAALVAVGDFKGAVRIIRLESRHGAARAGATSNAQADAQLAARHDGTVKGLAWIPGIAGRAGVLASGGIDGRIMLTGIAPQADAMPTRELTFRDSSARGRTPEVICMAATPANERGMAWLAWSCSDGTTWMARLDGERGNGAAQLIHKSAHYLRAIAVAHDPPAAGWCLAVGSDAGTLHVLRGDSSGCQSALSPEPMAWPVSRLALAPDLRTGDMVLVAAARTVVRALGLGPAAVCWTVDLAIALPAQQVPHLWLFDDRLFIASADANDHALAEFKVCCGAGPEHPPVPVHLQRNRPPSGSAHFRTFNERRTR